MKVRPSVWISRRAWSGAGLGAGLGAAGWLAGSPGSGLLKGMLAAALAIAGYALGVAAAYGRRGKEDLAYILRLREELRHSQNHIMDNATFLSLGAYVDASAEEIKEPLKALAATAGALAADPALPEGSRRLAETLRAHAERLGGALRHLAEYALVPPARAPFGVNTLLREAIHLCRHRAEEKKILFDERYATVPPVFGPAGRVHQALLGIIVNAIEAMPHAGGTIVVETAHGGDRVVARVRDVGIGIRPEHLPRVFDPFFTTKPEKGGVGLGLWAARRTLDLIGAGIEIRSAPHQGTEVAINFPQAAPVRAGREGTAHPPEIPRNTAEERGRRIA